MSREFSDGQVVPGTRYRVIGHLGSGGMGSVYLVEHVELGKHFVLKALFRDLATRKDLVARLRQEWRALGRLDHPNIVNVTDAGTTDDNQPYYVMERVEGETLSAILAREHAISIQRAIVIAASVLEALSAAHEIGIVHRDVKPPNIFVTSAGHVKLLDFGVAKLADSGAEVITARGVAIGTPRYMSPEQAKGKTVDARADLYAVGLVLYEAIGGVGPFDEARDANELLLFHITREAPRLSTFHRGVQPELDDIVASLLAKDPAARPASAHQVAQALRALVKRRSLPPSRGTTPEAGYEAVTGGAESVIAETTRPDGVAGRTPPGAGTTVHAPLVAPGTPTVPLTSVPGSDATTTTLVAPGSVTVERPPEPTTAGLDWAKDGFDTQAARVALGSTRTWVSPPPSEVTTSAPSSRERTQQLDASPLPPNEIPTHTSVPAVQSLTHPTFSGETPPPVHSDSVAAPARARGASGLAVVGLVVAALLVLAGGSWAVARVLISPEPPKAAAVDAPPAPAPTPAPTPSALPAPPPPAVSPTLAPSAEPPPAAPKPAAAPRPAPKPVAKPAESPKPPKDPSARPLPASGL